MGKRLLDINPGLQLTVLNDFIGEERIQEILEEPFDYVVDPSLVKVSDFGETYNCRLAHILRKKLRKLWGAWRIQGGFVHRTGAQRDDHSGGG